MSKPHDKPINPFLAARRCSGIQVEINVHDVKAFRPRCETAFAHAFLEMHKAAIAHAMLMAGTGMIRDLLEQPDGN